MKLLKGCFTTILGFLFVIFMISSLLNPSNRSSDKSASTTINQDSKSQTGGTTEKKAADITEKQTEAKTESHKKSTSKTTVKTETPETEGVRYTCTSNLNVRSLPSTEGEILGQIKQNDPVYVIKIEGNWATINYDGTEAFVSANYITQEDGSSKSNGSEGEDTSKSDAGGTVKKKTSSVSYSTNDQNTVKNGNSGVYAYIKRGESYSNYAIIDFDERYVYFFSEGNGNEVCERLKMDTGTLNTVLMITYHDGSDVWQNGLHFKYENQPEHLILQDNFGSEYDYYTTNLDEALELRRTKQIKDY